MIDVQIVMALSAAFLLGIVVGSGLNILVRDSRSRIAWIALRTPTLHQRSARVPDVLEARHVLEARLAAPPIELKLAVGRRCQAMDGPTARGGPSTELLT